MDLPRAGIGLGMALLMASAVAGGFLEALTRISWEKLLLALHRSDVDPLPLLQENQQYAELYERGVQSSYKWVTFHANMACALILVLMSRLHVESAQISVITVGLVMAIGVLLTASYVQWTYYVNYQNKIFRSPRTDDNAEK